MSTRKFIATALIMSGLSAAAFAHSGATGIVKERMDAMDAMGKAVKSIAAMMMGKAPYDADAVKQNAGIIKSHAGDAMTQLFPDGSTQKPSVAKEEIWSDWQEFEALATRLSALAAGLELAADNGPMHADNKAATMGGSEMMGTAGSNMMGTGMMGTGSSHMMGQSMPDAAQLANMPADGVFNMLTQTCSGCHTRFRLEKK